MRCIFFFNDPATTEIYTLSLHDALPICGGKHFSARSKIGEAELIEVAGVVGHAIQVAIRPDGQDRKSTRLNSSHMSISYAVFCLKKKIKILDKLATLFKSSESLHRAYPL